MQVFRCRYLRGCLANPSALLVHRAVNTHEGDGGQGDRLACKGVYGGAYVERTSLGIAVGDVVNIAVAKGGEHP